MSWKRLQIPLVLLLGVLLGFGAASYRAFMPEQLALAGGQEKAPKKKAEASGIFSPPGTTDTGPVTPPPGEPPFKGKIGRTIGESTPYWPPQPTAKKGSPNVLYIVLDDVGFAALGCYGSPVCKTPNLDKLAKNGLRYNNFHTTALCSPSRSCFLDRSATIIRMRWRASPKSPRVSPVTTAACPCRMACWRKCSRRSALSTLAIGKWHLTPLEDMSLASNRKWWPLGRGFDRYYGFLGGDTDQYYPWLTYDNHFVKPPATPEEGYHNVPDLISKRPRSLSPT